MLQCKKSNQQQPRLESGFLDNYNNNNDTGLKNDEASFLMTTLTSEERQDLNYKNYFKQKNAFLPSLVPKAGAGSSNNSGYSESKTDGKINSAHTLIRKIIVHIDKWQVDIFCLTRCSPRCLKFVLAPPKLPLDKFCKGLSLIYCHAHAASCSIRGSCLVATSIQLPEEKEVE